MANIRVSDGSKWISVVGDKLATSTTYGLTKYATSDDISEKKDNVSITPKSLEDYTTNNTVTLNTNQTITGEKTFTKDLSIDSVSDKGIFFKEYGNTVASLECTKYDGETKASLELTYNDDTDGISVLVDNEGNFSTSTVMPTDIDSTSSKQIATVGWANTYKQDILKTGFGLSIDDNVIDNTLSANKLEEYLYTLELTSSDSDYEYAIKYFEDNYHDKDSNINDIALGGCSSIRNGNFYGRNYDWYYNNNTSYVVHSRGGNGRFASLGVSVTTLDKDIIESEVWNEKKRIIPFMILDGINEKGLVCNVNVVPVGDKGKTSGTHEEKTGQSICMIMLPKYILDNFATAKEASDWIVNEAKIYAPYNSAIKEEMHFMISDKNETYVIEFIDNIAKSTKLTSRQIMTNFYLDGVRYEQNGYIDFASVTPYGTGLERFNLIVDNYNLTNTKDGMRNALDMVKYTNAYNMSQDIIWKTEFAAPYADQGSTRFPNLKVTDPLSLYQSSGILNYVRDLYITRTRESGLTWQTVHSSVYDIEKKELYLKVQEQDKEYHFIFPTFNNVVEKFDTQYNEVRTDLDSLKDKVEDIKLYKFPNATIVGEPIINNGQVSGFSRDSYLIFPTEFDIKDRGFEINSEFRTGNDVTTAQNIIGSRFCIALFIANSKLTFRASSNGTSWDIIDEQTTLDVQPNTTYYVRVAFNKLDYRISYSINGEDYQQIGYKVSTLQPKKGQIFIGIGNNQFNPFLGILNLNKWYIKLGNSIVWEGMDDVGLATRADVSLDNLDEFGQAKFDAKQDKLIEGNNITIENNVISANIDTSWGDIKGTLSNQTDLKNVLDSKASASELQNYVSKSGTETIDGNKSFSKPVYLDGNITYTSAGTGGPAFLARLREGSTAGFKGYVSESGIAGINLQLYNATNKTYTSLEVVNSGESGKAGFVRFPHPQEDTLSSTQGDTVGARNTKLANYVDLFSNQSINGNKTFMSDIRTKSSNNSIFSFATNYAKGTVPSSMVGNQLLMIDSTGNTTTGRIARFGCEYSPNGSTSVSMRVYTPTEESTTHSGITITARQDGTFYTYAPNPDNSSNNNNIATTYWTNTKLQSYRTSSEQDAIDSTFATNTRVDSVEAIAKGSLEAITFPNYNTMVSDINDYQKTELTIGKNILINTQEVNDLWVSSIENTSVAFTYTSDEDIMNKLETDGFIRVGYYKLSPLETNKIDLTGYVKDTDYATKTTAGVVKITGNGLGMTTAGVLRIISANNSQIDEKTQTHNPITPSTLDYAVKTSITTNTIDLIDEEKQTVQNWLGISSDYAKLSADNIFTGSNTFNNRYITSTSELDVGGTGLQIKDTTDSTKYGRDVVYKTSNGTVINRIQTHAYDKDAYLDVEIQSSGTRTIRLNCDAVTAPTPDKSSNNVNVATTAFVKTNLQDYNLKATYDSSKKMLVL